MDFVTRRVRRWINAWYVELRPLRHQLRNPAVRKAMLKWTITGTVLYVGLYVMFYIMARHKYLFGLTDYSSDLLMEQYERDLETCWHKAALNNTDHAVLSKWEVELRIIDLKQALHGNKSINVSLKEGIRREQRTVLSLANGYRAEKHPAQMNSLSHILDAGSCVVTSAGSSDSTDSNHSSLRSLAAGSPPVSEVRCLPSFIIAGAMKCGTGELMKWLQLHPKLALGTGNGDKREVHYFTSALTSHHRGGGHSVNSTVSSGETIHPSNLLDYVQFFPTFTPAEARDVYTFEKSPDYIRDPAALRNIHALLPSVKIVLLLRNPSLRALSEFNHHCRHGRYARIVKDVHNTGSGVHYLKGDVVRVDNPAIVTVLPKNSYEPLAYPCSAEDAERYFRQQKRPTHQARARMLTANYSIPNGAQSRGRAAETRVLVRHHVPELEHGFYEHQLRKLLELFPAGQVLVLLQEDMYRHTFRTLREVEEFLQLPCFNYQDFVLRQPLSATLKALLTPRGDNEADGEGADQSEGNDPGSRAGTEDDDGFYDAAALAAEGKYSSQWKRRRGKRSKQDTVALLLKPPKRKPVTVAEQIAHYRTELKEFLASWRGSDTEMKHLYGQCSPAFRNWLDTEVYKEHNRRLSALLHGELGRPAFATQHLQAIGWPL